MDNASKALIIAGEVLIAVLVLSLMASIFISFGNFSAEMHKHMTESQRTEFNSHFISMENRINITAQEIATIINYAKQMNDSRELEYGTRKSSEYYTTVSIDGMDVFDEHGSYVNTTEKYNNRLQDILDDFIKNNNTYYFCCNAKVEKDGNDLKITYHTNDIFYNTDTGLINKINFKRISPDIINVLTYN